MSDMLDASYWNVISVILLELVDELCIHEQLLGSVPVVSNLLACRTDQAGKGFESARSTIGTSSQAHYQQYQGRASTCA